MNADEPALFDMPCERQPVVSPLGQRGRNRETWSRTVTAEITIVDAEALREAAREARESAVKVVVHERTGPEDADAEDPGREADAHALDALTWLLWPTATMEPPQEVGAFRVLEEDIEVSPVSENHGTLTWTVRVKLTDVDALRRLAAQADPDQAPTIRDSLAAAWRLAADPFEPLHSIPAISWRPGPVTVQHLPRKP
jgi:hypothetical protein